MSNDALVEGIGKHIAQGDSPETIRSVVLEAGYTPEEFADAFARAMALVEATTVSAVPHTQMAAPPTAPISQQPPQAVAPQVSKVAEPETTKSPVIAIVLLVLLTFVVLGAVGFYILNPDFIRDFARSRVPVEPIEESAPVATAIEMPVCEIEQSQEVQALLEELALQDEKIKQFAEDSSFSDDKEQPADEDMSEFMERYNEHIEAVTELSTRRSELQSKVVAATLGDSKDDVRDVYAQYCAATEPIVRPDEKLDTSLEMFASFDTLYPTNELACKLKEEVYDNGEVHHALYTLGFHLMLSGDFETAVDFYDCAASRYYSPVGMYRLAQLHKYGSEEIKKSVEPTITYASEREIPVDYIKSYFWTAALNYLIRNEQIAYFDTSTSMGWNAVAMLDDLQMTKLGREEMLTGEQQVINYLIPKYPQLAQAQQNTVYNHSMDAIMEALESGQVNIEQDGNVTNISVSEDFVPQ